MIPKRLAGVVTGALLSLCTVPSAFAQAPPPPPPTGAPSIGLEVKTVDAATREVEGILHCVSPDLAGQLREFDVAPEVDLNALVPGTVLNVLIDDMPDGPAIIGLAPKTCNVTPGMVGPPPPPPGGFPPVGGILGGPVPGKPIPPGGPGGPEGHMGTPDLARGFLNRVWRFEGEADSYEAGKLSMTLTKILNLPKRFAGEDDDLVDQDTIVLVAKSVRVYDGKKLVKERREAAELNDAEDVRVQGKLLSPSKWQEDEDGQKVQTIRAKKIYLVG